MTSNGHERAKPLRTGDPHELGEYRLQGRLGRGGMGTVYLARDASDRLVAVKLIHPDLSDDEDFRRRFAREVESARRVARFSTAGVLDARFEGDPLYIVSEYVPGPNLSEAIETDGPMDGGTLESLSMGVAAALTAIHGAGVIHRDLKPANVLLSSVGPKVIDFGIARAMDDDSAVTRSSQLMGTPAYLAPELILGGDVTPASDIFSWGCLIAYAGTGKAPFDAPTVPAVLHQISSGVPNLEGLDPRLRELVQRALDKEPENRPTAQQLLNRLVGQEDPAESTVDQTVSRSWTPPSTALPGAAAGVAGAAAGAALGAAATGNGPSGAADAPEAAAPPAETAPYSGPGPDGADPTADLADRPTPAMGTGTASPPAPATRPMSQGPPSGPYAAAQGQAPSGPQAPGYGPAPGFAPGYGPHPYGGPSGPQQPPYGPPPAGMHSPPYGQPGYAPGGPGGPGRPPSGAAPSPSGGRRGRRTLVIGAGIAAVALAGTAAFGAMHFFGGSSFPEGSLVYSDEFDDPDSGWDSRYGEEFDPTDDFNLSGYTGDQYAIRATPDDTMTVASAAFEGDTPEQVGISFDTSIQGGPEYAQMGAFCYMDEDEETGYSIMARLDGTDAEIRREAGEGGRATLERAEEIPGFATSEEGDEATNKLQVSCEESEDEENVTIRLWVNDTFVLEAVDDDPLSGGGTALAVQRDGGGSGGDALVYFDNFRLTDIDSGE